MTTASEAPSRSEAPSPALAPPPGSPRFALFDSLRGIAVLFIIGYHVTSITGAINDRVVGDAIIVLGNQALILFFVISAFLLYRPYVAARAAGRRVPRTARYARRRVLRIVPAYWMALTALAIFPGIAGVFTHDWWRYYLFGQLYSHETIGAGIPPAWSLCVEVTFYIALPVWALAMRRLPLASGRRTWLTTELVALSLVALIGVAVQVAAARQLVSDLVAQSIVGQSVWLAVGMALAVATVSVERRERGLRMAQAVSDHAGLCWVGAAAALVGLTIFVHPGGLFALIVALRTVQPIPRTLGSIALTAILATLIVLPAVFGERAGGMPRRLLAWRPLAFLGMVSYGVYLWHLAVAELLGLPADAAHYSAAAGLDLVTKLHHAATPVLFVLTLAVSTAVAVVSYYVVELPFLRRKER